MISVIMPTNRVDAHFDVAVRSILDSVAIELQLIVVFDAIDPDLTTFPWADDPRLLTTRTPVPSGPGGAVAFGLALASGEYYARMDSDDYSHPTRLSRQVEYLESHPETVAVSCRTRRIDENGVHTGDIVLPEGPDVRATLLLQNGVPHSTLVVRRSTLDAVGGYRPVAQMEDYVLVLDLAIHGAIAQLPDRLLDYRVHSQQTSHGAAARGDYIREVIAARRRLARHLRANPVESEAKNLLWWGVQQLRSRGVVRARHRW